MFPKTNITAASSSTLIIVARCMVKPVVMTNNQARSTQYTNVANKIIYFTFLFNFSSIFFGSYATIKKNFIKTLMGGTSSTFDITGFET
jgi:hypothetical protein